MTRYEVGRDPLAPSRWAVIRIRDGLGVERCRTKSEALYRCAERNQTLANGHLVRTFVHQTAEVRSAIDAGDLLRDWFDGFDREALTAVFLNAKAIVIGIEAIHVGDITSSMVNAGTIYRRALINNAASVIIAHNHPSGDPTPSPEDILVTKQVKEAGDVLNLPLLDHLVIGNPKHTSLRDIGVL